MADFVTVPEAITVHLGPPNAYAQNVTVPFVDYIKNVASSEIFPTWPESALRANIIAQISIALNRVFNEFYRSQGYDFDITNSTQYDQSFNPGRDYFENISQIVDEIFNLYVVVQGSIQPYYTEYCDGINVTCNGLSQWGTVALANQGYTPYEILQYYYGDNINLQRAQTGENVPSYQGTPLRLGSVGEPVVSIQRQLNRISRNYPLIPIIPETDGVFNQTTENAVKVFQQVFNLTPDGIVGEATWYAIRRIYNGVKRLSELYSEGIIISEAQRVYPYPLRFGSANVYVRIIQYYLDFIAYFDDSLPRLNGDGVFGSATLNAVNTFQSRHGIPVTGVVDSRTWYAILNEYNNILQSLPYEFQSYSSLLFPGYVLTTGATGKAVEQVQTFLQTISRNLPEVPPVTVDGVYGPQTERAVEVVQRLYAIPITGDVGPLTWNAIVELYNDFRTF
ncbi:MAG: peptidoglycan-binding protein [Ruminococcus sp.]|nr:peptidoglycan-binding protein [Ruminococcus sp.]